MMIENNYVLIASDIPPVLTNIIEKVSNIGENICVTATRVSDCINILNSLKPKIIIIHFRDNQISINYLLKHNSHLKVVIIYLTKKFESRKVDFPEGITVFIQSYEEAIKANRLSRNITSIVELLKKINRKSSFASKSPLEINPSANKNLARYTLELDQKVTVLYKIKESIEQLYTEVGSSTKVQLMSIVNKIKMTRNDRKHWDDFKHYFENINPDFLKELSTKFPCLTSKDLKYCCYLKMNMSNEDIRLVLGINQESVRTHKYRLKKKMVLKKNQDLQNYLQTFMN